MSQIHSNTFDNGLVLLVEPIEGVQSVGMTMLLPGGACMQPSDQQGTATVLAEMMLRGAGDLDARQHSEAMDQLGIRRSTDVQMYHLHLGASFLGDRIDAVLPLLMDMVRRPQLTDAAFDPSRDLALQAIDALEDEPQQKVMIELKRRHLPDPLGRSTMGETTDLKSLTADHVRQYQSSTFVPSGTIIGLAGKVDFEAARDAIGNLLGDWQGSATLPAPGGNGHTGYQHVKADSTQQHIGLAYPAVAESDPLSMTQRLGVAVLSGGMSGRLFTEVREKRGLCYAVNAAYRSLKDRGAIYAYAGTTTQRAQETLDVLKQELQRMARGVEQDEFDRAVVGLKSRLVMQGESTSARANAIAGDQLLLGRPRTLDEMHDAVEAVTLDRLNAFLADHPAKEFTTLTIGPEPLNDHGENA